MQRLALDRCGEDGAHESAAVLCVPVQRGTSTSRAALVDDERAMGAEQARGRSLLDQVGAAVVNDELIAGLSDVCDKQLDDFVSRLNQVLLKRFQHLHCMLQQEAAQHAYLVLDLGTALQRLVVARRALLAQRLRVARVADVASALEDQPPCVYEGGADDATALLTIVDPALSEQGSCLQGNEIGTRSGSDTGSEGREGSSSGSSSSSGSGGGGGGGVCAEGSEESVHRCRSAAAATVSGVSSVTGPSCGVTACSAGKEGAVCMSSGVSGMRLGPQRGMLRRMNSASAPVSATAGAPRALRHGTGDAGKGTGVLAGTVEARVLAPRKVIDSSHVDGRGRVQSLERLCAVAGSIDFRACSGESQQRVLSGLAGSRPGNTGVGAALTEERRGCWDGDECGTGSGEAARGKGLSLSLEGAWLLSDTLLRGIFLGGGASALTSLSLVDCEVVRLGADVQRAIEGLPLVSLRLSKLPQMVRVGHRRLLGLLPPDPLHLVGLRELEITDCAGLEHVAVRCCSSSSPTLLGEDQALRLRVEGGRVVEAGAVGDEQGRDVLEVQNEVWDDPGSIDRAGVCVGGVWVCVSRCPKLSACRVVTYSPDGLSE